MLLLLMSGQRAQAGVPEAAASLFDGDGAAALRRAAAVLEEPGRPQERRMLAGQLAARLLLAMGRDEEAEEVFQRLLHLYEGLPREQARRHAALDRGALELGLWRLAAAAQQFNEVADDEEAAAPLRLEALGGMAAALVRLGETRRAHHSLQLALKLAASAGETRLQPLLVALQLELEATGRLRSFDAAGEPAAGTLRVAPEAAGLSAALRQAASALDGMALARHRLHALAELDTPALLQVARAEVARETVRAALAALRSAQLTRLEERQRIDAALACAAAGQHALMPEWLGTLVADEARLQRHRAAPELLLCLSHLRGYHGRHAEALRLFREYAQEQVHRLRRELPQLPYTRCLERSNQPGVADATELQLPARYRRAYRFIVDHLGDHQLSINQVAAQVDVTVRALQMAFRHHLGMTPAELIRRRRMEAIRTELLSNTGRETILDVATRWGMGSRSTLTQNYRQQFGEAPSRTLRQGGAGGREPAGG